jgi:hypothetical protein
MTSAAESLGAHARMRQVGLFLLSWWMASMTVLVLPEGRGRGREREREREGDREREDEARLGRVVVLEIF